MVCLISFQFLGRESKQTLKKLCEYYIVRGYQPVFCKEGYLNKLNNDTGKDKLPILDLEHHEIPGRTITSEDNDVDAQEDRKAHESSEHDELHSDSEVEEEEESSSSVAGSIGSVVGHAIIGSQLGGQRPQQQQPQPIVNAEVDENNDEEDNDKKKDQNKEKPQFRPPLPNPYFNPHYRPPQPPTGNGFAYVPSQNYPYPQGAYNSYSSGSGKPNYADNQVNAGYGFHLSNPTANNQVNAGYGFHLSNPGFQNFPPATSAYQTQAPAFPNSFQTVSGSASFPTPSYPQSFQANPLVQSYPTSYPSTALSGSGSFSPSYGSGSVYGSGSGYGYGYGRTAQEDMSPYIQTEYVTARELKVDGKKYLAVEARDSSDQLKKVALAAALTGAALTYVKHKQQQQRYPQPNPYFQTSPYATGGYNSFNSYPTFSNGPTYATSPYQTYPSYSSGGSFFGPFKREGTVKNTAYTLNPHYLYYAPASQVLASNIPKDPNDDKIPKMKSLNKSQVTQGDPIVHRDIQETPVVKEEDLTKEQPDDDLEAEIREEDHQDMEEKVAVRQRRDAQGYQRLFGDGDDDSEGSKPSLVASGAAGLVGLAAGSYLTNQLLAFKQQQNQQPYRNPYPYQQSYHQQAPFVAQPVYVQPAYNPYQETAYPAYGNTVRYPSSSSSFGGSSSYYPSSSGSFSSGYGGSSVYGYGRIAPKSANIPTEHISAKELDVDGKQYLAVELKEQSDNLKEGAVSSEVVAPLTLTTELITARELEVDGKQYLAIEARDSSDQLKKVALAAALTGAALTYVKHKQQQQRYPQPNPYYQTSPYATAGYNSFNSYPSFSHRPTYVTSPYQTYPSYSSGGYGAYGFGREAPDGTNVPTEYITPKEMEVDGKQYLAVELTQHFEKLKREELARELPAGTGIGNRQYQPDDGVRVWLVSYNQNQNPYQGTRKPQSQSSNNVFTGLLSNGYVSYFPDGNRNGVRLTKRK